MKISAAERHFRDHLREIYSDGEASVIASMLLENITGFSRSDLLLRKNDALADDQQLKLNEYVLRLRQHEPVQYVIGKAWFFGLEFFVDPSVLIPRPETEELVRWIVDDVAALHFDVFEQLPGQADKTKTLKILDVGTGSGCIALALKNEMPRAEVWGCDVSEKALNVARRNGSALNIRVDFQGVDFLNMSEQKSLPTVDIVVSNPPYVSKREMTHMQRNVVDHEPHVALFVPDEDPLIFYKALIAFGEHRLYENGIIYMEIHESLGTEVKQLFSNANFFVELRTDMQGKERMVKATKL